MLFPIVFQDSCGPFSEQVVFMYSACILGFHGCTQVCFYVSSCGPMLTGLGQKSYCVGMFFCRYVDLYNCFYTNISAVHGNLHLLLTRCICVCVSVLCVCVQGNTVICHLCCWCPNPLRHNTSGGQKQWASEGRAGVAKP